MISTAHQAHIPNDMLIGSAVFTPMTQSVPILYNGTPFPPKNCPFPWGDLDTQSNTWLPGTTRVLSPNGILIAWAIFAGLTSVTDRQTDHATRSATIGCIFIRSTAMQPNNCIQILTLTTRLTTFHLQQADLPTTAFLTLLSLWCWR